MDKKTIAWTFMALLVLPAIFMFMNQGKKDRVSMIERRMKGEFPEMSLLKTAPDVYFDKAAHYVEDRFPFREFCLTTYTNYHGNMKTHNVSKRIIVGKEGWWYRNHQKEYAYYIGDSIYTQKKYKQIKKVLRAKTVFFVKNNIPVYLVMPRNKYYVAPEYLPGYIRDRRVADLPFDIFSKKMNKDKRTPKVLNTGPVMQLSRKKGLEPYYKRGTHWNTIGSFFAYNMLMKEIKKDFPETNLVLRKDLKFRTPTLMDSPFSQMEDPKFELKEWYVANNTFNTQEKYENYTRHYRSKSNIFKTGNPGPRLLILGDSFTDFMIPYLYCSFSEILFMHHKKGAFSTKEAIEFKPDLVVFEIYESLLNDNWNSGKK